MKSAVTVARIIVGILFIISGLIKANDPSGLAYKMDEYFAVWGIGWATNLSLPLSLFVNALEVAAGIALLVGWAPRFITRLLLLLIVFFTFLTGYAVFSGKIKTCGCFGDCIPLTAMQSCLKDLVLLLLILILVRYHRLIKPLFFAHLNAMLVLGSAVLIIWAQLHVLKNLPFVDCLPYKEGNNLHEQMQVPPGAIPDSTTILFTYKKDGKELSFDAYGFPDDFDEDSYEFVKREEKVIRKGNATPAIADLTLTTQSGTDTTADMLASTSKYILFSARDFDPGKTEWAGSLQEIYNAALAANMPVYLITNQPLAAREWLQTTSNYGIQVLTIDGTVLKTFLRTPIGAIAMEGPVVRGKWSDTQLSQAVDWIKRQ